MRITYDPVVNAAYVYLTDEPLTPGRDSMPLHEVLEEHPGAIVVLDWKDDKIVGLEVLEASSLLHADLLAQATRPGTDPPVVLIALDEPCPGMIAAQREGEPSFTHVQDIGDAMMAALARGVDLIIPADLADDLLRDLPRDLPAWVKTR